MATPAATGWSAKRCRQVLPSPRGLSKMMASSVQATVAEFIAIAYFRPKMTAKIPAAHATVAMNGAAYTHPTT